MKYILVVLITLSITRVYSQTTDLELDRLKKEFKRIDSLDKEAYNEIDYSEFISLLEEKVKENPENTEARYFLGYAYSRKNANDGSVMIDANVDLVIKSSEQFEEIIKLTPKYTGEIIGHNPYDKIGSEWGSLALKYMYEQKKDSVVWAFQQGQKRGGFSAYTLQLYKERLKVCSKNAVLLSSGDMSTFSLYYLQTMEGFRKDVAVVDVSLLESKWYPKYLVENSIISFDVSDEELETIDYLEWNDQLITIGDFSWVLKPSYNEYLFRGDRLLLSFLKQNEFKRDVYFTVGFHKESDLSLRDHLTEGLIVDKLAVSKEAKEAFKDSDELLTNILKMTEQINPYNDKELNQAYYFRIMAVYEISDLFEKNELKKAKELIRTVDKYVGEAILPFRDKEVSEFMKHCRKFLNN